MADSAGVKIISNILATDATEMCVLSSLKLRIGASGAGATSASLYRVSAARQLSGDRVAVLNRGSQEILVFDEVGDLERSIGGQGQGPGEFMDAIEFLVLPNDSLLVWDWELNRLSVFDGSGTVARTATLAPPVPNPTGHMGLVLNGTVIAEHGVVPFLQGSGFVPQNLHLLTYDDRGVRADTIVTLPFGHRGVVDQATRMMGSPVFDARGSFTTWDGLVLTTDGTNPEVRVEVPGAGLNRIVRWDPGELEVTHEDVVAYRERRLGQAGPGWESILTAQFEQLPVERQFPVATALAVTADGVLWVRRYPRPREATVKWWSFDRNGVLRCTLELDRNETVMEFVDGGVLLLTRDDLGLEYVESWSVSVN